MNGMNLKLILDIVFYSSIGLVVIGFLIGMARGLWKTTYSLIMRVILFVVAFFITPNVSAFLGYLKIIPSGAEKISAFDYITNYLVQLGIQGNSLQSSQQVAYALAGSIISYVTFFLEIIAILLLSWIVTVPLYHLIFKHIVPKKVRKHKIRPLSCFVGALDTALCMSMILAPLTSLTKIATENEDLLTSENVNKLTNNQFKQYLDLIKGAGDSVLLKSMGIFDKKLMNEVSAFTIEGEKYFLIDEVNAIVKVVEPAINGLKFIENGGQYVLDKTSLIEKELVVNTLDSIINSKFILKCLPIAVEIAMNSDQIPAQVKDFDLSNIDWETEFTALSSMYASLYDSGVVSGALNGSIEISASKKTELKEALNEFSSLEIVKKNLPKLMAATAANLPKEFNGILSTDESFYTSIDWNQEFDSLVDVLIGVANLLGENGSFTLSLEADQIQNLTTKIVEKIKTDNDLVRQLFVGKTGEESSKGLLDMNLINNNLPALLNTVLTNVPDVGNYITKDQINSISKDFTTATWKNEFDSLIGVAGIIIDNENLPLDNIDLSNSNQVKEIKKVVAKIDESKFLTEIVPSIVENAITQQLGKQDLFGITAETLDFRPKNYSTEVNNLLDVAAKAMNISDDISSSKTSTDMLNNMNVEEIGDVLRKLQQSKIINPTIEGKENTNFENLISNILSMQPMKELGLILPTNLSNFIWNIDGENNDEIDYLMTAFQTIKDESSIFLDSTNLDIKKIQGKSIEKIFTNIGASSLLEPSLASILNKSISTNVSSLGLSLDFNVVTDWAKEGKAFGKVLDSINYLGKDIADVSWLNEDPNKINAILTSLKSTQVLGIIKDENNKYYDSFGRFVYNIVANFSSSYFGDKMTQNDFEEINDDKSSKEWSWINSDGLIEKDASMIVDINGSSANYDFKISITNDGEIKTIVQMIEDLQSAGGDKENKGTIGLNKIMNSTATTQELRKVLNTINKSNVLYNAVPSMIKTTLNSLPEVSGVNFSDASVEKFESYPSTSTTGESREQDINRVIDIYALTKENSLDTLFSNPSNISEESIDVIDNLLTTMASISFFNSVDAVKQNDTETVFNQFIIKLVQTTKLDTLMVENSTSETALPTIKSHIKTINNWSEDGGEVDKICTVLRKINGIDINNISNPSFLKPTEMNTILLAINDSSLLHPSVPGLFENIFESIKIDSMLLQNHTINARVYTGLENIEGVTSQDKTYWSKEISEMSKLFSSLYKEGTGLSDLNGLQLGGTLRSYSLIAPINNMQLLKDYKHELVYSMLKTSGMSNYLSGTNDVTKANGMLITLFNNNIVEECSSIDAIVDLLNNNKSLNFSPSDGTNRISSSVIFDIMMTTNVNYDDDENETTPNVNYQSLLTTDLLSGFLFEGLNALDQTITKDYLKEHTNIVEARGLQGLIDLSNIKTNGTKEAIIEQIEQSTKLMGISNGTLINEYTSSKSYYNVLLEQYLSLDKYTYVNGDPNKVNNHNSYLARKLFTKYADLVVFPITNPTMQLIYGKNSITLTELINHLNIDLEDPSMNFEDLGIKISQTILAIMS